MEKYGIKKQDKINKFKIFKSVHHCRIQINHKQDATVFQFIVLTFIYSSTCFGRSPAPEVATAVIELLTRGGRTPETCWALNKRQDNKLENCCIWLVIYLNCTMMHGLTNLRFLILIIYRIAARILNCFFGLSPPFTINRSCHSCNKTANGVFRDAVHGLYRGVLYF